MSNTDIAALVSGITALVTAITGLIALFRHNQNHASPNPSTPPK